MLHRLRERTEVFLEGAARDRCRFELEGRPDVRIGARHARAPQLFDLDAVREVQRALAGAAGAEEKRLRFLLEFLAEGRALSAAAGELDRLLTWEAHATLAVRDRAVPFRAARAHLRLAADPEPRAELEEARLAALDEQLPVVEGLLAHRRGAVEELGYGPFLQSCEVLSGIDLRGLAREGERFLSDTDPLLRELLAWHLPRLAGVEPGEAGTADAALLEGAAPYLEHFPDSRLLPRIQAALAESGLDTEAGGRLRVVTRPRVPSGEGAVCCALRVPDEVLLTVSDAPGRAAHASLLRGIGLALHRAHTSPDLPVELRRLGDASVPLAISRTFEGLLASRPFLERVHDVPRPRQGELLRLGALLDLLRVRRAAGLLRAEVAVFGEEGPPEAGPAFVEALGQATGLRHDPREALWALRTPFRSARVLRAEQLAAALAAHLRDRFDEDWWRNPRAGAVLTDLFREGQCYTAPETSVQLVSRPLSFDAVRERLEGF